MFTTDEVIRLREAFRIWSWTEQSEGRPFVRSTDEDAFKILAVRAVKFGAPEGHSAWTRAARELEVEGVIKLGKLTVQGTPIPTNFQDQLNGLTPGQLRSKITPPANPCSRRSTRSPCKSRFAITLLKRIRCASLRDQFNRWSSGERHRRIHWSRRPQLTAVYLARIARPMSPPSKCAILDSAPKSTG